MPFCQQPAATANGVPVGRLELRAVANRQSAINDRGQPQAAR